MGCSSQKGETEGTGMHALFDTRQEAENAANKFGCRGAHKMGNMWMPCSNHGSHFDTNGHKGMDH